MKKLFRKLFAVAIFLLAVAAAGADAQAQWYPGPIKVWGPQWIYYGGGYGSGYWVINHSYRQFGGYYPGYYDIDLSRLSRRGRFTLGGAVLGGAIGVLAGGRKGAAIGIGGGALGGLIFGGRGEEESKRPIILTPGRERSQRIYFRSFVIRNRSGFAADIYDGRRYLGRLYPSEEMRTREARDQFRAVLLIPRRGGYLARLSADLEETDDGWEIVY